MNGVPIDVTGIDQVALLMELHNNTTSPDTWACNLTAKHRDITVEEAREFLDKTRSLVFNGVERPQAKEGDAYFFPDYVFGRPFKAFLEKGEDGRVYLCNADSYDRDSFSGNALSIVNSLKGV